MVWISLILEAKFGDDSQHELKYQLYTDTHKAISVPLNSSLIMSQNGPTQLKNLAAFAARLLKRVWPFWDIMHQRVKKPHVFLVSSSNQAPIFIQHLY